MDLILPNEIESNRVYLSLREDLDGLQNEIDAARPIPEPVVLKIANELTRNRVHQSNAIEGNPLTLRETVKILESGQLIDVGRKRESLEALNLGKAIQHVQDCLNSGKTFADEKLFLAVHKTLLTDLRDDIAGMYRQERVVITGAKHQPPRDPAVLMKTLFESLANPQSVDPVLLAAWCHWAIARIHPFEDGNGRMSRLWQDFILLSNQYTPAIIPFSQQSQYYEALAEADDGDFDSLLQMVTLEAIRTSQTYLNVIRENDETLDWAKSLVGESEQRIDENLELEYARWTSRVRELREAFRHCVILLNRASTDFEFLFNDYDMIPQPTWESLRSEPRSPQIWCFRIVARTVGKQFQYVFFSGKHFRNPFDVELGIASPLVNLIVSEKCGPDDPQILSEGNSPVSLRELLVLDGKMVAGTWDRIEGQLVYEQNASSMAVARRFLEEVIRSRLTN